MNFIDKENNTAICFGFTLWKRPIMHMFFKNYKKVSFARFKDLNKLREHPNQDVYIWASAITKKHEDILTKNKISFTLVEDGFIRSRGLGIKLYYPASLCFSQKSIHYNCSKPSALEECLSSKEYSDQDRSLGNDIINSIKKNNISKYGLDHTAQSWSKPNKHNVLVIGQVADDASVKTGSPNIKSNQAAIVEARRLFPISNLAYKPHPDVTAKLREGEVCDAVLTNCVDQILENADLIAAIKEADTVITMSSQAGIDALILDKHVVCLGQPFYAGWGLTDDQFINKRRTRKLTLSELVFTCFHEYPTYINPKTGDTSNVIETINLISDQHFEWPKAPKWMRIFVKLKRYKRKLLS